MHRPGVVTQIIPYQQRLPLADREGPPGAAPPTLSSETGEHRAIHVSGYERKGRDFYATPVWVIEALLRHVSFRGPVWEPCCGDGAMSTLPAAHRYEVVSTDIANRDFGTPGIDLLACRDMPEDCPNIVTRPPSGTPARTRGKRSRLRRCWRSYATPLL